MVRGTFASRDESGRTLAGAGIGIDADPGMDKGTGCSTVSGSVDWGSSGKAVV